MTTQVLFCFSPEHLKESKWVDWNREHLSWGEIRTWQEHGHDKSIVSHRGGVIGASGYAGPELCRAS